MRSFTLAFLLFSLIACGGEKEDCTDGIDNDNDGLVDCDDENCWRDEACEGRDTGCGTLDWYPDSDGDGYGDGEATVAEACSQPSGHVEDNSDCDDSDQDVNPDATELCNGHDDDCDGTIDEGDAQDAATWYADSDSDGYGDQDSTTTACGEPDGYTDDNTDCDDSDGQVNPGADELCDEVDNDCDGSIDEDDAADAATWYLDSDSDGYGDPDSTAIIQCAQPTGYVDDDSDCDDGDAAVNQDAAEACDGVDNDCDGTVDDAGCVVFVDSGGSLTDLSSTFAAGTSSSAVAYTISTGGSLHIGAGTYYVHLDIDSPTDSTALAVMGGAGSASTTLSGDGTTSVILLGDTSYDEGVSIQGLTITGGSASYGGGLNVAPGSSADVELEDCHLQYNDASYGAGIYGNINASIRLTDVEVSHNTATDDGGGLYLSGPAAFDSVEIHDNAAGDDGGGLALDSAATEVVDLWVHDNSAADDGGGVICADAFEASFATIEDNSSGNRGGGLYGTMPQLTDSTISGNQAVYGGGLYTVSSLSLDGSTVSGNAAEMGGGIYTYTGTVELTDTSVEQNTAEQGGGICTSGGTIQLNADAWLQENEATTGAAEGGGIYVSSTGSIACDGSSGSGTGFIGNVATQGGGVLFYSAADLTATACDWGVDASSDDNSPQDIRLEFLSTDYNYGDGETFTCDSSGCY